MSHTLQHNCTSAKVAIAHTHRNDIMTSRKHGLMRIFWPSDAPQHLLPGVLVGWRNSELDVLVIGVLQGVDARNVEHALRMRTLFRGSPHSIDNILERCGGQMPQVLGTLNGPPRQNGFDPKMLSLHGRPEQLLPAKAGATHLFVAACEGRASHPPLVASGFSRKNDPIGSLDPTSTIPFGTDANQSNFPLTTFGILHSTSVIALHPRQSA